MDWETNNSSNFTKPPLIHRSNGSEEENGTLPSSDGWQSQFVTVNKRIAHLYNNSLMSDVLFVVGKVGCGAVQRCNAHKFILAISSSVFDVMFYGTMAGQQRLCKEEQQQHSSGISNPPSSSTNATSDEACSNNSQQQRTTFSSSAYVEEIIIDDVEPAPFATLLRFIYTDQAEITHQHVMSTLYLAKKYVVPVLEEKCINFLESNLAPDNAFLLLTQARLFDERQLMQKCIESIDKRTTESLDSECFLDIDMETLCMVLQRDSLQVREAKLFAAVLQWSQYECQRQQLPVTPENQRQVLGRSLQMVRFPIMTLEEFANGAAQSGVLTDAELVKLFLHFTVNPKPDIPFLDVPRNCYTGKEHVISRFARIDRRWGYSSASDCIRMSVSRPIFVVGLGLYGSAMHAADYAVTMEIIDTSKQRKLAEHKTNFMSDANSQTTHRVLFRKPIGLQAEQWYLVSVNMKGPDSYYGTGGQATISHDCGKEGCVQFNFQYSHGTNNGTSVEDGQIPEILFYVCGPNSMPTTTPAADSVKCGGGGAENARFSTSLAKGANIYQRPSSINFGATNSGGSFRGNTVANIKAAAASASASSSSLKVQLSNSSVNSLTKNAYDGNDE